MRQIHLGRCPESRAGLHSPGLDPVYSLLQITRAVTSSGGASISVMCHDDESQSHQTLFSSVCRSLGTRIIRLDRGYSTQWSCNLDTLRPGDAALLFVLYHLFSKHINGKAEFNQRVPPNLEKYRVRLFILFFLVKIKITGQDSTLQHLNFSVV